MNTAQQNEIEKIDRVKTVAVIGSGYIAQKAAARISENGYPVLLASQDSDMENNFAILDVPAAEIDRLKAIQTEVSQNPNIEILSTATLVDAAGTPGNFTLKFQTADTTVEKSVGAIALATGTEIQPLSRIYGLTPGPNVVSLSEFENLLASADSKKTIQTDQKTVAFLVGFAQEGNPLLMKRVLNSVSEVVGMDGCSAYVYVNNIKVADDGLERLYKKCRDNGAMYFKLQKAPAIRQENDDLSIRFYDPVIRNDIELNPDMIVVEESLIADEYNLCLAEILRIDQGAAGFLQKENVHRLPVNSNREGIFVIGSSRDIQNYAASCTDIDNMLLRVKALMGEGTQAIAPKAVVDREKCTICLTCYRCCPHGAIYWDDKAVISPLACQGCGICASECPMDAIQLVDFSDAEISKQIQAATATSAQTPKIVAFCCQNSAYEAGMAAKAFNYELPEGLEIIKVPCAGKIDIHYMLNALVEGADGVLVLACHHGNCKSESGNTYAKWRINDAYQKLEQIGIDKDRLEFATLASNMAPGFARIVVDMEKRIRQK